uniref:Uncharacterized protein n=1 Tax=Tetraselmis sp. GSL018 TaxID=582737 RepID=A0A061R2X4_9CHLO
MPKHCQGSSKGGGQVDHRSGGYIPNPSYENHPALLEKLHRRVVSFKPYFIHTLLTSCHQPPRRRDESSWLLVWQKAAGLTPGPCAFAHCGGKASCGAHVSFYGSTTFCASWYIAAACSNCNRQHNMAGELRDGTPLVKVVQGPKTRQGTRELLIGAVDATRAEELLTKYGGKQPEAAEVLCSHSSWRISCQPADKLQVRFWPGDWRGWFLR